MLFENTDTVCTQHYNRQLAAFQILLISEALIRRDHDVKTVPLRNLQKIAVDEPRPALFLRGADVVLREIAQKLIGDVLIEQDAQIVGFPRTALRL